MRPEWFQSLVPLMLVRRSPHTFDLPMLALGLNRHQHERNR